MTDQPPQNTPEQPDENANPPKPGRVALLKKAAHYALLGFAPVIAIIALVFAVMAFSANRSIQTQTNAAIAKLDTAIAKLDAANAALKASKTEAGALKAESGALKTELSELKAAVASQKAKQDEELKKLGALTEKIAQDVSRLEAKAKPSPAQKGQSKQSSSASGAASTTNSGAPKQLSPQTQAIKEAIQKFNQKR